MGKRLGEYTKDNTKCMLEVKKAQRFVASIVKRRRGA